MRVPKATATNKTPSGTPRPIPILPVLDKALLAVEFVSGNEGDMVSGPVEGGTDVDITFVGLACVDGDASMKLYDTGGGSSVYLFETPKVTLVMLSPYDSPSAVNG